MEKSWFNKSKEEVEQELKTNVEKGLSNEEVQAKREKYGYNELKAKGFVSEGKEVKAS